MVKIIDAPLYRCVSFVESNSNNDFVPKQITRPRKKTSSSRGQTPLYRCVLSEHVEGSTDQNNGIESKYVLKQLREPVETADLTRETESCWRFIMSLEKEQKDQPSKYIEHIDRGVCECLF